MGCERGELSVLLTGDAVIRDLNARYRDLDRATDVLSFSMLEGDGLRGRALGDVVISVETAARQARRRGRLLVREMEFLLIHGVLHIFGYDHRLPRERRIMRAKERELMREIARP